MAAKCPICGSTRIEQHRMPYGPIWCLDCGFRVEDKTAQPNPFLEADGQAAAGAKLSLGQALCKLFKSRRQRPPAEPPQTAERSGQGGAPAGAGPPEHTGDR